MAYISGKHKKTQEKEIKSLEEYIRKQSRHMSPNTTINNSKEIYTLDAPELKSVGQKIKPFDIFGMSAVVADRQYTLLNSDDRYDNKYLVDYDDRLGPSLVTDHRVAESELFCEAFAKYADKVPRYASKLTFLLSKNIDTYMSFEMDQYLYGEHIEHLKNLD
jgi:hypothetical protein